MEKMEYRVEVKIYNEKEYYSNNIKFETIDSAKTYGLNLFSRWQFFGAGGFLQVEQWRLKDQNNNVIFESNY